MDGVLCGVRARHARICREARMRRAGRRRAGRFREVRGGGQGGTLQGAQRGRDGFVHEDAGRAAGDRLPSAREGQVPRCDGRVRRVRDPAPRRCAADSRGAGGGGDPRPGAREGVRGVALLGPHARDLRGLHVRRA